MHLSNPSQSEFDVLKVVWGLERPTSRLITQTLKETKNWENTTVKTLLSRLVQKGYLTTSKEGREYVYTATISETDSILKQVDTLLDSFCETVRGQILEHLVASQPLSNDDKARMINAIEKREYLEEVICSCASSHHHSNCGCVTEDCTCQQ